MGLEQGVLEAYKKDYFKINVSLGSVGGSVRASALNCYKRRLLERATNKVIRKDG